MVNASLEAVHGGGTAERTYCLAQYLARLGEQVSVLTTDIGGGDRRLAALPGITLIVLHSLMDRFYLPTPAIHRIYRAVRDADVVHLMNHWTAINVLAYWAARLAGRPYVVSPAGALPAFGRSKRIKALYNALAGRAMVRHAARGIAITASEIPQCAEYGLPAGRIAVIPNGVELHDADATTEPDIPVAMLSDKPYILFLGRLNSIKGPDLLLEAFLAAADDFPNVHLALAGPDEGLEESLRAKATHSTAVTRIHFVGAVSGGAKRWLLQNAKLVAIPSRQEAMSIVVLEAGAQGRPVLLTDQCGFPQLAEIGGGAIVPATARAIAGGLRELLMADAQLGGMGLRLREAIEKRYTWDAAALALRNCLIEVVGEVPER